MTSSLASQLANIGSLNAQRLASSSTLNNHTSYLFPPKTAAQQDLFTVHALATSGWSELCSEDSSLAANWDRADLLFSDQSRQTDRLMLSKEENAEIDVAVRQFLQRVGAVLLSKGTSKCLEWLVRRFRIHDFTPADVLAAFIPYHDTPQFGRMLSICKIEDKPYLQFLLPYKKSGNPLPASVIQTALLAPPSTTASLELLRWVAGLVAVDVSTADAPQPHRALVSFWTSTLVQMSTRAAGQDRDQVVSGKKKATKAKQMDAQSMLTVLLPAAVQVASTQELGIDAQIGGFMLICSLANSFPLSRPAVQGIFGSLAKARQTKNDATPLHPAISRALLAACYALCASPEDAADPLTLSADASDRLVPDSIARSLVNVNGISATIRAATESYNVEAFLANFISALVVRLADAPSADLLESLLALETLPDATVVKVIRLLLELPMPAQGQGEGYTFVKHLQGDMVARARANRVQVLSALRQSRSILFDAAVSASTKSLQGTSKLDAVWTVVRSVMSVEAGASFDKAANGAADSDDTNVLWLAIHSADAAQRDLALKQLIRDVSNKAISAHDTLVKDALHSRIQDSSSSVLETLYSQPRVLLDALDPDTLLDAVVQALSASTLTKVELGLHLRFLLSSFVPTHFGKATQVLQNVLWPRLLLTTASKPVAETVAKTITKSKSSQAKSFWSMLAGTAKVEQAKGSSASEAEAVNNAIAREIATEINKIKDATEFGAWANFLFEQAQGRSAQGEHQASLTRFGQILAILVLIHLLSLASEQRFNQLASRATNDVALQTLAKNGPAIKVTETETAVLKPAVRGSLSAELQQAVYRHAEATSTLRSLSGELLQQVILGVEVPAFSQILESFSAPSSPAVGLLSSIYATANTLSTGPALSKQLLQSLFLRLQDSVLPFLASIWIRQQAGQSHAVRLAALRHAGAYLQAYTAEAEAKDFQAIVPAILVALRDGEASIRLAALACIDDIIAICNVAGSKPKNLEVFGYDTIYGPTSKDLQYLELASLSRYLCDIKERATAFRNDAHFVTSLHKDLLNVKKQDGRKEISYKHSIVCYLTSHVVCWNDASVRLSLLESLAGVSDGSKLATLLPLIRSLVDGDDKQTASLVNVLDRQRYAGLLFSCFDKSSRSVLEDGSNGSWISFLEALSGGSGKESMQVPAVKVLQHGGLFTTLSQPMRQEAYQQLASVVSDPAKPTTPEAQACLRDLEIDASILVPVLAELRDTITTKVLDAPEAKRSRTSLGADETVQRATSVLVVILEAAIGKKLALSGVLVFEFFEVLRLCVELHASLAVNAEYMLQLSMIALSNLLEGLGLDAPTEIVQSLRADTIMNAIKASHNPQTFQHALLLLSRVANIAPEPVLHNVMPIFTFVGSTVLQRDDAFSYTVVERTLKSIVPALVASLKQRETTSENHFGLLREARAFIRIFTDAAHYVPKHRRQVFFKLLSEIMGPEDFSAAIAMLLVDRSAFKIVKQPRQDVENTLQLPLIVLQDQPVPVQLRAVNQIWDEVHRIWTWKDDLESLSEHVFLDRAGRLTREHTDSQAEPIRQIQALILFIRHVLSSKAFGGNVVRASKQIGVAFEDFIRSALAAADPQTLEHTSINAVAREALDAAMPFVPIANVMNVVTALVQDSDAARKTSGFSLFASRIAALAGDDEEHRAASAFTPAVIGAALDVLRDSATPKAQVSDALRQAALDAIKAVSAGALASEHGTLASTLPVLVSVGEAGVNPTSAQVSVLSITRRLADKLGPRLIPHLSKLVPFCLGMVSNSESSSSLRVGALDTLTGLFSSVPTFMTGYIGDVVRVSIQPSLRLAMSSASGSSTASERSLTALLSALIKRTNAQGMFEAVFKLYDAVLADEADDLSERLCGLFDFLARALRQTDRAAIAGSYKAVFRFLLRALDQRRVAPLQNAEEQSTVERHAIAAFLKLVLKLNESTFKPLFLRMFDWAVLDLDDDEEDKDGRAARQLVLYRTFNALVDQLRALVAGYYSVLLEHTAELLSTRGLATDLRTEVLGSVYRSARWDEGSFWNPARVRRILPGLLSQLAHEDDAPLVRAAAALVSAVPDEATLKEFNASVLQKARAPTANRRTRTHALRIATALWDKEGEAMLAIVPETVAQLSELLDDDENAVAREAAALREKIELALGESLDSYLT